MPRPARFVFNNAVVLNEGTFTYKLLNPAEARAWLRAGGFTSYVTYEQTAARLAELAGVHVPLSHGECSMGPGDEALVCRLAGRMDNPATKRQMQTEGFEYGILRRWDWGEVRAAALAAERAAEAGVQS